MVRLDDALAHRQPQAEANLPRGEKWRGHPLGRLGAEPAAVVVHLNLQRTLAVAAGGRERHVHLRIARIGLEGIQHDFRQRVLECRAVADGRKLLIENPKF